MGSLTSTPRRWARRYASASRLSRRAVWAFVGIASTTVRVTCSVYSRRGELTYSADCGIRPATSTEAEFLQDYIHKSNNTAGQQSVNAARLAVQEQEGGSGRADGSDEEEEDESDGANSGMGSKRNSLHLPTDKAAAFPRDLADKTPTANTALSQAQAQRPNFSATQASIRRHPGADAQSLAFASTSAAAVPPPSGPLPYPVPQPTLSVRQFPNFPQIEEAVGANSTSPHGIAAREVWGWFLDHLDAILDSVRHFRFDQFEMTLRNFWMNLTGNHREVVHAPAIAGLMAKADAIVYDVRVSFLVKANVSDRICRRYWRYYDRRC